MLLALLLTLSAMAVYISLETYPTPTGVTLSSHANASALTAKVVLSLVMALAGLATIVFLVVMVVSLREDAARERKEQAYHAREERRSWIEQFLEPRFLSTPKHIQARKEYFETLIYPSSVWKWGLFSPSLALTVIVLIRLFLGAPVFLGDPSTLDFGWESSKHQGAQTEKSASFGVNFDSYGHATQGFLASLLATPVVMKWLLQLSRGRYKGLIQVLPFLLTIYPTYNLIKRFVKTRKTFASSSFDNNSLEWASGFVLGMALGQSLTAISSMVYVLFGRKVGPCGSGDVENNRKENHDEDENGPDSTQGDENELETSCAVSTIQRLFGLLLLFTVYAAGVLFGITWHACAPGAQCVNANHTGHKVSAEVLSIMIIVPTVMQVLGGLA